jgi:hypothetical protein
MNYEAFRNRIVTIPCAAVCPKVISISFVARMNRDFRVANLTGR